MIIPVLTAYIYQLSIKNKMCSYFCYACGRLIFVPMWHLKMLSNTCTSSRYCLYFSVLLLMKSVFFSLTFELGQQLYCKWIHSGRYSTESPNIAWPWLDVCIWGPKLLYVLSFNTFKSLSSPFQSQPLSLYRQKQWRLSTSLSQHLSRKHWSRGISSPSTGHLEISDL